MTVLATSEPSPLMGKLWCVEPNLLAQMVASLEGGQLKADIPARVAAPETTTSDGIARIRIQGLMLGDESLISRLIAHIFGATLTPAVTRAIEAATADGSVKGIALEIASGGGDVSGVAELAGAVRSARAKKPLVAHTATIAGSAAYWVASQAGHLVAGPAAEVGSIGGYAVMWDESEAAAKAGVKVHVISSAPPIKGAGVRGTPITDEQLAAWRTRVDDLVEVFIAQVAEGRGMTSEQVRALHTGQVWTASKAKGLGLVDDVASLGDAMRRLRSEVMEAKELTDAKAEAAAANTAAEAERTKRLEAEKKAEDLQAQLNGLQVAARKERFAKEAKDLGLAADFAPHLDSIEAAVKPETYQALLTQLKAQSAQIATGKLLEEAGTAAATGAGDADTKLKAIAKDIQAKGEAKDFYAAYALACKRNPDLVAQAGPRGKEA